jgi:hypothetical protein
MVKDLSVAATGFLEGHAEFWHPVKRPLLVDFLGQPNDSCQ